MASTNFNVRSAGAFAGLLLFFAVIFCGLAPVEAETIPAQPSHLVPQPVVPQGAQFDAAGHLDVEKATRAYLDTIPPDKRAASDKYFEGKYWISLWEALWTIAVTLALLFSGISSGIRDRIEGMTRFRWLQAWLYFAVYSVITLVAELPLSLYTDYYREHIYNQSHQPFGGWARDQMVGALLSLVLGGIFVATLYALVRRLKSTWHLWGASLTVVFMALSLMFFPVYIAPLFNTYTLLQDPEVTRPVLAMAHANGIPVDKVYEVDASRQSTQVSANVSGLFGTTRITLNDNLLHQSSLPEIEDTMGHEMGHYVLHHSLKSLVDFTVILFVLFALLKRWLTGMDRRWRSRWGTRGIDDIAMFPAVVMAFTVLGLALSPLFNTIVRTQEFEADMYGLNAAREPDASAQVDLKLGQYRKLEPGPVEEFLFFDHPSGYTRIRAAMQWKSDNARTIREAAGY